MDSFIIVLTVSLVLSYAAAGQASWKVFLDKHDASEVIARHRRANEGNEEKNLPPNLERECVQEVCSYEEAREIFQDTYRTDIFWSVYVDGDQCAGKPCKNGGMCADSVGSFDCVCKHGFVGPLCEIDQTVCTVNETRGCSQFCKPGYQSYECSCAKGYKLKQYEKCEATELFSCGKLDSRSRLRDSKIRTLTQQDCQTDECPWQVLLKSEESDGFCSGVILKDNLVLTTAQCASMFSNFQVIVGKRKIPYEEGEQVLYVSTIHKHPKYQEGQPDNDLALLKLRGRITFKKSAVAPCLPERDFAENALMGRGPRTALVMGYSYSGGSVLQGNLQLASLPYLPLQQCRETHSTSLTNKMFCTSHPPSESCFFGPGSPVITVYKQVAFLTGVLSRPQGFDCDKGYVYQKISRFLPWLRPFMETR
ncbi:protein Z, vitamin K-dependent plasma glycoprotein a [Amia ocellicauda]|uniref:protein Z, vitamin K-dependent plasma glycoprotein a n=1 Tax=Amia ocellicauda TaxID=2972642 RepID=UPI003463E8BF